MVQQVKDLELSLLWLGFAPWPRKFLSHASVKKKKKKKKTPPASTQKSSTWRMREVSPTAKDIVTKLLSPTYSLMSPLVSPAICFSTMPFPPSPLKSFFSPRGAPLPLLILY